MGTYRTYTELTDAGPFISKLLLEMPEEVAAGAAGPHTFNVFVIRRRKSTGEIIEMGTHGFSPESVKDVGKSLSWGYREVTKVYPCNEMGMPQASSSLLALEMPYGPTLPLSLCSVPKNQLQNEFVQMDIRVTQLAPIPGAASCMGLVFDTCGGDCNPGLAGWDFLDDISEERPLRYGYFTPKAIREGKSAGKHPLLIWLHGAGGGGTDPRYPVQGNKVTAFAVMPGQKKLGFPWLLVPQSPTFWMDDGTENALDTHNRSIYTETLKKCIDTFIADHEDQIDRSRIYLAGASNGGFMTVLQAMTYPDFYAAVVPVCEAINTARLQDEDIEKLTKTPAWFVHTKGDFVVPPETTVIPLYQKLKAAGANVHFTFHEDIHDTRGLFKNADGTPYRYIPHFAWVPTYNDECTTDFDGMPVVVDGRAVTLQEWVGLQRR